jgi:hypothetical protein
MKEVKRPGMPAAGRRPMALNFSIEHTEQAVRRKSFADTLQYPATMLPAAVCLISGGYLLLLAPIFGGGIGVMAIGAISAIAAAVSFRVYYPRMYKKNFQTITLSFDIAREQLEEQKLTGLINNVKAGFVDTGSAEGLAILERLADKYNKLTTSLNQQRITDPLSVSVVPVLAGETYRTGLEVLLDTLELMNVVKTPGKEKIEESIKLAEREVEQLKDDVSQAERRKLKEEVAASLKERLAAIDRMNLWIEQLLYQAQRCEAALHTARIELAIARTGSTQSNVNAIINILGERIKQVREVQEEINKLEY